MADPTLYHLTVNTGHVALTQRSDVANDVIEIMQSLLPSEHRPEGYHWTKLPGPVEWWLRTDPTPTSGWALFVISPRPDSDSPFGYARCVGVWDESKSIEAWDHVWGGPEAVPTVPWLAIVLGDHAADLPLDAISMLGDLERCVFWTLADLAAMGVRS